MNSIIKAAWPNPQRNTFKIPFETAARSLKKKEGVALEYIEFSGAEKQMKALEDGKVDIAFATGIQIVALAKSGVNVKLVLGYLERQPFRLVTSSKILRIEELRGKTLSFQPGGGISEQALKFTVSAAGLKEDKDYKLLPIVPIPEIFDALSSGKIDGGPLGIDSAYHFIGQHPGEFHILGGDILESLPRMVVVGWITTDSILKTRSKYVELFAAYLGKAYDDGYRADISWMADISKEMPYLEDYSLEALRRSTRAYVDLEIWPKNGVVIETTWNATLSELRRIGLLHETIPFENIAYHTLGGGN